MRVTLFAVVLLTAASAAVAQSPVPPQIELRPVAGAYIPTGVQRDLFKDAAMFGVQGALEVRPNFHVVGSFAWSPGHDRFGLAEDRVNLFQYDAGVEYGPVVPLGRNWEWKPFAGVGAGARTYDYRATELDTNTCFSGYGALGTEFQYGVTALRIEARDYLYCYKHPILDESKTRNEVGLSAGIAYHFGRRIH